MVDQVKTAYIPMGIEHDPRIPPLGRVITAEITHLPDGEYALDAKVEVFEEGDVVPLTGVRRMKMNFCESEAVVLVDDRAFRDNDDQKLLEEVRSILGAERETEGKKAVEPIAVLIIALKIGASGIVGGIGKRIGEDLWRSIRPKLKALFQRKRNSTAQLLNFAVTVEIDGAPRLVEVILSDPRDADVDSIGPRVLEQAISAAAVQIKAAPYLVRFVYGFSADEGLAFSYAVSMNGVPILGTGERSQRSVSGGVSIGGDVADV